MITQVLTSGYKLFKLVNGSCWDLTLNVVGHKVSTSSRTCCLDVDG
jgi:hypothetical protein